MIDITCLLKSRQFLWRHVFKKKIKWKGIKVALWKIILFTGKQYFHTSIIKEWMKFLYSQTDNNTKWLVSIWRILTIQFSYQGQISVIIFFLLLNLKDNKNRRSTNVALTSIKTIKVLFYSEMIKLNYFKFILLNEILVLID